MTVTKIDGELYRRMLRGAAAALQSKKEEINNLNVFPVPDGDTGTNMSMTLDPVCSDSSAPQSLGEYSDASARQIMRSARGNSGVILSLFFRGMAKTFSGHEEADAKLVTEAFQQGAESARKAVLKPVEGTILTVMRECCQESEAAQETDISKLLDRFLRSAQETLKKTPDMLPALKKAKVVDSGGSGFTAVLDGMKRVLSGEALPDTMGFAGAASATETVADFASMDMEDIRFGFCTECLINKRPGLSDAMVGELRSYLAGMGDSIVITDDDEIIKVHIHTNEPFTVLSHITALGELQLSKIENMKLQLARLSGAKPRAQQESKEPPKPWGVVAVANGDGFTDTFKKLGADAVIAGGQSMNPPAGDFLKAIRSLNCRNVVLLPNNPNIVLTARQAAELAEGVKVTVVPTVTMPQGISALIAYNPNAPEDAAQAEMSDAATAITTYSLTQAVKDADIDGLRVKKKQFIGLVNNKLRFAFATEEDCLRAFANEAAGRDLVTIYYGKGVKRAAAERVESLFAEILGEDTEVSLVEGSQPIYNYIISAE